MAFTDENGGIGATMLVSPTNGNGGGFGNGFGGDSWAWIILLLLLGWGNNGGGFGGGFGGFGGDYPWLANGQQNIMTNTNNGFRDAMINDGITSIRDGISSLSTQLCNCCSDTQMALANGFAGVEQGANARQIANMQTAFAGQTAMNQGFNAVQSQLAQCCCDNRLATCQTQNIVQNEANATRFADANNTRDIIQSQADGTRAILDKLCSLELEAKNDTIAQLRSELLYARGQASQDVQTARILAGQVAETDAIYNRLNECPVGTTPVFGRTPIFQCNGGCGCSGNTFIN
jgi:hypothetical protein